MGLSDAFVREEKLEDPVCAVVYDGRLASVPTTVVMFVLLETEVLVEAPTAEDNGADRVFFIREKMDVTRV